MLVTSAGFNRFRRATETPFNIVYEARSTKLGRNSGRLGSVSVTGLDKEIVPSRLHHLTPLGVNHVVRCALHS
jgi:hypothetical protein